MEVEEKERDRERKKVNEKKKYLRMKEEKEDNQCKGNLIAFIMKKETLKRISILMIGIGSKGKL